jgi:hypothetical protein
MKMETLMNIISNIANFREGCELYIFVCPMRMWSESFSLQENKS